MSAIPNARTVAVIDIGKTNAKVALVDLDGLSEIAVRKTPNVVAADGPYPHFDSDRLWDFATQSLADLRRETSIDAISVTTHGAAAALLASDGSLALPVLDYEHDGPDSLARAYDAIRPAFAETGSPRLPSGLNLGAQLFWQQKMFPRAFDAAASIVPYPQYFAFRLSGVRASEAASLGAHTDLWNPAARDYSSLVRKTGWLAKMAPLCKASDRLGPMDAGLARYLGLPAGVPVACGIHDSNASLYPHLLQRTPPFSVVSTGTWVILMSVGAPLDRLDSERDCLVNVDAFGNPVASARFMGGREFQIMVDPGIEDCDDAAVAAVIARGAMLLPTVQPGAGPFLHRKANWVAEVGLTPHEKFAAVSLYLGMMTATCLDLTGAAGPVIVEGPFAANRVYLQMLAAITQRPVQTGGGGTGTSIGAALLAAPEARPRLSFETIAVPTLGPEMRRYFDAWYQAI